jgi:hypothetical protein
VSDYEKKVQTVMVNIPSIIRRKKYMTYGIRNLSTGSRQAPKCGGVKSKHFPL